MNTVHTHESIADDVQAFLDRGGVIRCFSDSGELEGVRVSQGPGARMLPSPPRGRRLLPVSDWCRSCDGSGDRDDSTDIRRACNSCRGTGRAS